MRENVDFALTCAALGDRRGCAAFQLALLPAWRCISSQQKGSSRLRDKETWQVEAYLRHLVVSAVREGTEVRAALTEQVKKNKAKCLEIFVAQCVVKDGLSSPVQKVASR